MSQRNRHLSRSPLSLPSSEAQPASFRTRLLGIAGLVVSATLATAIGSTTLTGLILDHKTDEVPVALAPTTQPAVAPATQPTVAEAPTKDVLSTIPAAHPAHVVPTLSEEELAGIGIETRLANGPMDLTGSNNRVSVAAIASSVGAGGSSRSSNSVNDPYHMAYPNGPLANVAPVTFGGSPDLADAADLFHTQASGFRSAYEQLSQDVVADVVPALGMDTPGTDAGKTSNGKPTGTPVRRNYRSHEAVVSDDLTWETTVNSRPNGEFGPRPGASNGDYVDPFDSGTRLTSWGEEIPGTGVADSIVPEPTTLLSLAAFAASTMTRRRRR